MRQAGRHLQTGTMTLATRLWSSRLGTLELPRSPAPHGGTRPLLLVAAAEAGRPHDPPGQRPSQRQQQQQQHAEQQRQREHSQRREAESMSQQWHVRRTELRHFPDEVQQRIRSSGGRSSSRESSSYAAVPRPDFGSSSARGSSAMAAGPGARAAAAAAAAASGSSAGAAAGAAAGPLAADLEKLAAALAYERRAGYVNVIGSVEKVPVADWAARHLLVAAGQLQAHPAAAHACVAAAARMRRYAAVSLSERQAAVAAAEVAAQQALQSLQTGRGVPAGHHGIVSQPQQAQQPQLPQQAQQPQQKAQWHRETRQPQQPHQAAQQPQRSQQSSAAGAATSSARTAVAAPFSVAAAGAACSSLQPQQQPEAARADGSSSSSSRNGTSSDCATSAPVLAAQLLAGHGPEVPPTVLAAPAEQHELELDAAAEEAHAEESGQQAHTPEGEEYVMRGNRRIKATTAAFHRSFAEAAAALERQAAEAEARGGQAPLAALLAAGGEQRTDEWLRLRERRLTASAFSKAIGLFDGDRQQLWGEKVGMIEPFKGNDATQWGTQAEPKALQAYEAITGQNVSSCMFQVRHEDLVHGWLGASPDGLIESLSLEAPSAAPGAAAADAAGRGAEGATGRAGAGAGGAAGAGTANRSIPAVPMRGAGPLVGPGRGILEIKCPYNRGQPELAVPPQHATWYYMPQVQGLMYIFDCEWCNLYIWTAQRGSAVYHIRRDRDYWALLWEVLADFWWNHVVPARQEFQTGRWEEVEQYRPPPKIDATEELQQWSKRLALAAPATFFGPLAGSKERPPATLQQQRQQA